MYNVELNLLLIILHIVILLPPQTPVLAVVGNDACWSQISREQVPILGSNVACGLAFTGPYICKEYCNRRNRSWFEQSILGRLVVSTCIDRFSVLLQIITWWLMVTAVKATL